jgi:hypothetical protein
MVIIYTTRFNNKRFYFLPKVYLCISCGSQNKEQIIYLHSILMIGLYKEDSVFLLCGTKYILNVRISG